MFSYVCVCVYVHVYVHAVTFLVVLIGRIAELSRMSLMDVNVPLHTHGNDEAQKS